MQNKKRVPAEVICVILGVVLAVILVLVLNSGPNAFSNTFLNFAGRSTPVPEQKETPEPNINDSNEDTASLIGNVITGNFYLKGDKKTEFHFNSDGTYKGFVSKDCSVTKDATYKVSFDNDAKVEITYKGGSQTYEISFDEKDNYNPVLTDTKNKKSYTLIQTFE
jgi:hypothetical protein